jgi:allophanate hydrolase
MPTKPEELDFSFHALAKAYADRAVEPEAVAREAHRRVSEADAAGQNAWLHVREVDALVADAGAVARRKAAGETLPLFGLPFAVKDNIDVAGMPTTLACPALAYLATESCPVVDRLQAAGALVVGKTNLDQLATGLVGARSPYGVPVNPFDARMIPGGSSSGSAVAVASGQVSFALGTDTAGSGRVPAAFNNVVGFKPTRGALSTRGVAPACRSIDCVTVFAMTVADACAVLEVGKGWDERDPFSRAEVAESSFAPAPPAGAWRVGVPRELEFLGDDQARGTFLASVERLRAMGCDIVEVDLTPFREAGALLYGGPWVAERLVAGGALLAERPDALLPVIRAILSEARAYDAVAAFTGMYRLAALKQATVRTWRAVDALVVPTTPTIYRVDQVLAEPRTLNANLGIYTTFANLLDLAAIAIPAGLRADQLPAGITILGPAGSDARIAALAAAHHQRLGGRLGATAHPLPADGSTRTERSAGAIPASSASGDRVRLAVVGAHLTGQPLNHQLTNRGAVLVGPAKTASRYRLFALPGTTPPKPGLVRSVDGGRAIELEVWALDSTAFGRFVAGVAAPLCIGSVELEDGSWVHGFLCEGHAVTGAEDISEWGGWRAYAANRSPR